MKERWGWAFRTVWAVVLVVLLGAFAALVIPRLRSLHEMRVVRDRLDEETRRVEERLRDLSTHQQRFSTDPRFVERTAHDSGRYHTNETVFIFPPGEDAERPPSP